jgi:DNA-binding HxlR family transcriptional regulator
MVSQKPKKTQKPTCPVSTTVRIIGGKWKPTILYYLLSGTKRFNELQRLAGNPSARILTAQLRELEKDRIVKREVYDQIPPRVEYSLTARGKSLNEVLNLMARWGQEN